MRKKTLVNYRHDYEGHKSKDSKCSAMHCKKPKMFKTSDKSITISRSNKNELIGHIEESNSNEYAFGLRI